MFSRCSDRVFDVFRQNVLNLRLDPYHCLILTYCLSSSLLPSSFISFYLYSTLDEDHVSKALVFLTVLYGSSCRWVYFSRAVQLWFDSVHT